MLSRRQIRIKVLQSLYAFFQAQKNDLAVAEKELFRSIEGQEEVVTRLIAFAHNLLETTQGGVVAGVDGGGGVSRRSVARG